MSVTRNYARHLRVITVLQTITLQLRIVTRKVRNYAVMTHFTHLQRNAGSVTRNSHTLPCAPVPLLRSLGTNNPTINI